ncbi:MAG: hypothetical protein KM310_00360 [Clostridiales bacterium]|nr:hypothetical protein [Clostridiales bacterium]
MFYTLAFMYFFWPRNLPPALQVAILFFMGLALLLRLFRSFRGPYHPPGPLTAFDTALAALYFTVVAAVAGALWPHHSLWIIPMLAGWFLYASFFFPYDWLWAYVNGFDVLSTVPVPAAMQGLFRKPPKVYIYHDPAWWHPYRLTFPFALQKGVLVSEKAWRHAPEYGIRTALYHLLLQERSLLAWALPWIPPVLLTGTVWAISRASASSDIRILLDAQHRGPAGVITLLGVTLLLLHLLLALFLERLHRFSSLYLALDRPLTPRDFLQTHGGVWMTPFFEAYLRTLKVPGYAVLRAMANLKIETVLRQTQTRSLNRYRLSSFPRPSYPSLEEWERRFSESLASSSVSF